MGILDSLKIGDKNVKLKPARQAVRLAQTLLATKGVNVLPGDQLNELNKLLAERTMALDVAKAPDPVKKAAIGEAITAVKTVEKAVETQGSFKEALIERFTTDGVKIFDTVLKPLREKAALAAPGAEFKPQVQGELEQNDRQFRMAIRKAKTALEARKIYDDAVTEQVRLANLAKAIKPEEAEQSGKDQVAAAKLFKELQQGILAMEMANAPGAESLSSRLYATLSLTGAGNHAGALLALQTLEKGLGKAAENNQKSADEALKGPREAAKVARDRFNRLAQDPEKSKLSLVKAVLPTITGKLDTLDLFLNGNLTPKSATAAEAMIKEINGLILEAETLTPEKDKQNKATIGKIKETLAPKSFIIFKGQGAEAEKLFPKEYAEIVRKKDALSEEIEGMGVAAATKTVQDLMTEAQKLVEQAAERRLLLNKWRERLPVFENAIKSMNGVVKADPEVQKDPKFKSKTASGPFVDLTAQFKRGLDAAPPDAVALQNLLTLLETQLVKFNPVAKGYDKLVLDAHKTSKTEAAEFAANKESAEPRCKAADDMLKLAKDAVGKADPADKLSLKMADAEITASKKQVRAATEPDTLKAALERLENAIKRAEQLKNSPGGDAPHSRAELGKIDTRWQDAVGKVRTGLADVRQQITDADNLPDPSKKQIGNLIDTTIARFDANAFTAVIKTMTTNPSNENEADRMKAREQGLRLVRQFRDMLSGDPVISSLVVTKAFRCVDAFTSAHQALNDLDLNLSRAV